MFNQGGESKFLQELKIAIFTTVYKISGITLDLFSHCFFAIGVKKNLFLIK